MISRGCRCCFPWKILTLLLVITSLALVSQDVKWSDGKVGSRKNNVFIRVISPSHHNYPNIHKMKQTNFFSLCQLKFAKSRTGIFFAEIGVYDHAEKTYKLCARGYKWTVDNVPLYYNQGQN